MFCERVSVLVAAAIMAAASPAAATVHTLTLTGDLATATSVTFNVGPNQLTQAALTLTGFTPFTLVAGDEIDYSVAFTGFMFGVPAYDYFRLPAAAAGPFGQLFGINFGRSDDTNPANASNAGTATPVGPVGDQTGVSYAGACSNCLTPIMGRAPGPFGSFGFHGLDGSTIVALDGSYDVDKISFTYQVQTGLAAAVPEPESWALLLAGFGLTGALLRRRKQLATASA